MTVLDLDTIAKTAEEPPDLDFAGEVAAQVHEHWDDPSYRNALLMSLGTFIEEMIYAHKHEWQDLVLQAADNTVTKARRAVIKAYLSTALEEVKKDTTQVHDYTRGGRRVRGYDREFQHRGGGYAARTHLEPGSDSLSMEQAADLGRTINAYTRFGSDGDVRPQAMHFTIESKDGKIREAVSRDGRLPDLARNERVTSYKPIGIDQPVTLGGETFNVMQALGASPMSAGYGGGIAEGVQSLAQAKGGHFGKVKSASQTFYKLAGGEAAPPAAQAAAMMGIYIGNHGPEVSKVLGPHMRRYTYKYRGMTASPTQISSVAKNGKQPGESPEAYEVRLAHALASTDKATGGMGAIPTQAENALLLGTGSTAPSHGFIVDKNSRVRQQAVGVADDHYVPFNLAELHSLNGGSYVRSRAYGGPTTEDLSLALRTGAKRFTVVSRHGAYTVELEQRASGIRHRYGDTPVAVVNRYGRLLDGVQSGTLKDPETGENLRLNGKGYDVALKALKTQYPLLIKDVKYFPPSEIPGLGQNKENPDHGLEDSGYIRPYYLKPSQAVNGYYDDALGAGALNADQQYDALENYRFHKANVLLAERDARAAADKAAQEAAERARVAALARNAPTPAAPQRQNVPNNLPRDAQAQAEAGGGTQTRAYVDHPLSMEDTAKVHAYVKAVLGLTNSINDPDLQDVRNKYNSWRAGGEEGKAWTEELRTSAVARNDLFNLLDEFGDSGTGVQLPQLPDLPSAGIDNPQYQEPESDTPDATVKDLLETPRGKEYQIVKNVLNWRDNAAKGQLGPEKTAKLAEYEKWMKEDDPDIPGGGISREQAWTGPREYGPGENLTYLEDFENELAEANHYENGGNPEDFSPPHKGPKDTEPPLAKLHRAYESGDPSAAQEAQDAWERQMLSDVPDQDRSG